MASNDITGDSLTSKIGNKEQQKKFSEGFDRIFGKKDPVCKICGKGLAATNDCAFTGCPLNWNEDRIDTVGQNGNDGLHYDDF